MQEKSRDPAVAGTFYDFSKEGLEETLSNLFSGLPKGPGYDAVIAPHAGYMYSGRTAARAISALRPSKRFIILGPNHTGMGSPFSLMSSGTWKTPLGPARIDQGLAGSLRKCGLPEEDDLAHAREHSIEVILPFLQHRFGQEMSFVPLSIMGSGFNAPFLEKCRELGSCIARTAKKHSASIIASSDFSHYISWDAAKVKDYKAIDAIKDLDLEKFFRVLMETRSSMCGYAPVAVLMAAAKELGFRRADVLEYTSSGDVTGDKSQVVAYAAVGFRK